MNALGRSDVLAELRDCLIGGNEGVERVEAHMRHGGGMCRAAVIDDRDFGDADARHGDEIDACGMHHHGGIELVEGAFLRHQFLAAALFFRRRAEIADATGQAAAQFRQCERGAQTGGRDDVVAAGMADAGQCVIFRQNGDLRPAFTEARRIGGRQAESAARDREVGCFDAGREDAGGLMLVEGEFGL